MLHLCHNQALLERQHFKVWVGFRWFPGLLKRSKEKVMERCELLERCLFFNDLMKDMPTVTDMMKRLYCLWHYEQCARYRVASALGKKRVPADLFPNDTTRAKILLAEYI